MQASVENLRPQSAIPRTGLLWVLTHALSPSGSRIDMLSDLRHLHRTFGNIVLQDVGLMKMVNLFGAPDSAKAGTGNGRHAQSPVPRPVGGW
jgi:hypothetical protein